MKLKKKKKYNTRGYTTVCKCKLTILNHEFELSQVACMYFIQMGQIGEKNTEELIGLTQTYLPLTLFSFKTGSCHEPQTDEVQSHCARI